MIDYEKEKLAAELKGSFLEFTKTFFPLLTGREFIISNPTCRESHHITIAKALTAAFRLEIPNHRLLINVAPGYGKSVMLSMWVAWCLAHYPDSNFLYISYSKSLAAKHTEFIRSIILLRHYQYLFDVQIKDDSRAKDLFKTTYRGVVGAYGSSGSITGQDAGLPGLNRFSGAIIIDDAHKPGEVHSDTMRDEVIKIYNNTVVHRKRGTKTPMIFIGQRLHEADLANYLVEGKDGYEWQKVILKSLDSAGNALYPEVIKKEDLLIMSKTDIYSYAAQHQQDPQPAGGAIFKPEWFVKLYDAPKILETFITADTAETDKDYNDATVFSFWGIYKLNIGNRDTEIICLHWIDCYKCRVEPRELENEFLSFYSDCMRYKVQPRFAAIEKKSTGTTLISVLKNHRGLSIRNVERTKASGSKTVRYLEMQKHVSAKKISFDVSARHADMCIKEASKITANDTHRNDDIIDTMYDAVKIALIDKLIYHDTAGNASTNNFMRDMNNINAQNHKLRTTRWRT